MAGQSTQHMATKATATPAFRDKPPGWSILWGQWLGTGGGTFLFTNGKKKGFEMGVRGKKSVEELTVVTPLSNLPTRPDAPEHLTEEQRAEWKRVVDACPADWFPVETLGLLESYCLHMCSMRQIEAMIGEAFNRLEDPLGAVEDLNKLHIMRERESRAASSAATRLRITNQALTNHKKSREGGSRKKKPWETT